MNLFFFPPAKKAKCFVLVTGGCGCIYPRDRGHDRPALRNNHCLLGDPESNLCSLPHPLFSLPCTHTVLMMLGDHHVIGVAFILATDNLTAQRGGRDPSAGESMDETSVAWDGPFQISPRVSLTLQTQDPCSANSMPLPLLLEFSWESCFGSQFL